MNRQRGFGTLLAWGIVGVLALAFLGGIVYKIRQGGYDAAKAECLAAAKKQREREEEASKTAAAELETERQKRKVVVKERTVYVDRIVDRPIYRNVCLDDDGLRCVNAALRGESGAGCKSDDSVPPTKPSG